MAGHGSCVAPAGNHATMSQRLLRGILRVRAVCRGSRLRKRGRIGPALGRDQIKSGVRRQRDLEGNHEASLCDVLLDIGGAPHGDADAVYGGLHRHEDQVEGDARLRRNIGRQSGRGQPLSPVIAVGGAGVQQDWSPRAGQPQRPFPSAGPDCKPETSSAVSQSARRPGHCPRPSGSRHRHCRREVDQIGRGGDADVNAGMGLLEAVSRGSSHFRGERGQRRDRQDIVLAAAQQAVGRQSRRSLKAARMPGEIVARLRRQSRARDSAARTGARPSSCSSLRI